MGSRTGARTILTGRRQKPGPPENHRRAAGIQDSRFKTVQGAAAGKRVRSRLRNACETRPVLTARKQMQRSFALLRMTCMWETHPPP